MSQATVQSKAYSGTSSDVEGIVVTVDDLTPTPSAAWQINQSAGTECSQSYTAGADGYGVYCTIATDGSGNPTFTLVLGGHGYEVDDTITFVDPGNTTNTATLVVASVKREVEDDPPANDYSMYVNTTTGDLIVKINDGSEVKTTTLVDFSEI